MATPPKPTDAEMEILSVLWERGPATVRDVFGVLSARKRTGYTTVLKVLQIMTDKGLVKRDASSRTHIYRAALSEAQTHRSLLKDLLARAFGGSKRKLLMSALDATRATPEELDEIRKLIDSASKPQ
jgi:BlaI family transcriptional regulator, penicillinase repressor